MKEITKFYKEHIQVDLEVTQEDINQILNLANRFQGMNSLGYLYHVFETSATSLQNYMNYHEGNCPEYFKNVSGNKVIKVEGGYMGVIDLWYPREINLFNLIQNPIMAGWVVQDLLGKMEKVEDIFSFPNPDRVLKESLDKLVKEIKDSEFYGFWMGDVRNSMRKKPIKIRRLGVTEIKLEDSRHYYSDLYPEMKMCDKDTGEIIEFNTYNLEGWCFYLSKELLAERLKDLESYWMRGYDQKVKALDNEVKVKRKELENLINRRKNFENGITEYQKKLHEILWKSF